MSFFGNFFTALIEHSFLQSAVLAGVLSSIVCGTVGTYVYVRRISYIAGGITHSVLGGMGIAFFLGRSPMMGALITAVLAALLIGWITLKFKQHEDTLISALWSVGMAIGVLFLSKSPESGVDLMSFLFGNILMVGQAQLWTMLILVVFVLLLVFVLYRQFQSISFDPEFTWIRGLPVSWLYLLLLCLIAVTSVILIQMVGMILVIALLTLPAALASLHARTLGKIMIYASLYGVLFSFGGIALSYEPDLPTGATIIVLAGGAYLVGLVARTLIDRRV